MKKEKTAPYPLPEVWLTDASIGTREKIGMTIIDAAIFVAVAELEQVLVDNFKAVLGNEPPAPLRLAMRVRNHEVIHKVLTAFEEPLRDGFQKIDTKQLQRDGNRYSEAKTEKVRALWVSEYHRRAALPHHKVTKNELFTHISKTLGMSETKAREVVRDIPWPPPHADDEAPPESERVA
ncbi:hypothetical protein [Paraburkholderia antibiotica]|uniref:Uncharacterized protein n=1 Tax=Paraburkholderia antibiotica TaxID=2728839 RepID=A0A7X9X0W6_9BURK|nr:hypothetical protein [Paraburkholderia antibiotica]NML29399.1 hypothetical protein [Paraburkholderia antibiotica]